MSQHPAAPDDANTLPRRTTPTWEMELLLSGAAVFAMVQLAQAIPAWAMYLLPRLEVNFQEIARLLFVYTNSAVLVLVLTFVLHLLMRAYWVGLVGMNSVYPDGLKWDAVRTGPIAKSLLKQRWPSMPDAIERADNRATVVFSVGIGLALVFVPIMLVVAALYLLAAGTAWMVDAPGALTSIFFAMVGLWLLPYIGALALDRRLGHRLKPDGWVRRATAGVISAYSAAGMARESNPLVSLYSTQVGERRGTATVVGVMLLAMALTWVASLATSDELGPGNFAAFSDPERGMGDSVAGRHYASMHDPQASPALPYLPELVSSGKYLRLVVPYVPEAHGHLLRDCAAGSKVDLDPNLERIRRAARLACLAKGFDVRLDGVPLADAPHWYTEPRQDLRGLLYMIPAQALSPGRHELSVMSRPAQAPEGDEPAPQPYLIPFWR